MKMRPIDTDKDVLPVLSSMDMLDAGEALAALIDDKLNLLLGEWWEQPSYGNAIFSMIKESRMTPSDVNTLSNYLSDFIRSTPGVLDVTNIKSSIANREFVYSCTVEYDKGTLNVSYEI